MLNIEINYNLPIKSVTDNGNSKRKGDLGMKVKKVLGITLAAVMASSLCACSSGNSEQEGSEKKDKTGKEKVKLTYTTWNENQRDSIQATIDGFNKIYPDIEVEIQITPWNEYWTKLEAAASSGNMADIVTMHTNTIAKYVNGGKLAQLDDLDQYDETFSYDNYPEGITRLFTIDEKHYGVPKDKDCVILVYNKEIFDNAGVPYPDETWTWDDLKEAAEKLTDKEKGIYGFNAYNNSQEAWGNFLYQNGGSIIDEENNVSGLDNPKSIEAMEFYMDLFENCSPSAEMQAETDYLTMFATGTVAMQPQGNWQMNYYTDNETMKDKVAIAPLPAANDGNRATQSNGIALSIPENCKNMEAAKKFVAYASSEQGMKDAAGGPAIPAFNGVEEDWSNAHKDMYDTNVILEGLTYGVQFVGTESKTQWEAVMNDYIAKIMNGEVSVEEGFTQASKEMNKILATEK